MLTIVSHPKNRIMAVIINWCRSLDFYFIFHKPYLILWLCQNSVNIYPGLWWRQRERERSMTNLIIDFWGHGRGYLVVNSEWATISCEDNWEKLSNHDINKGQLQLIHYLLKLQSLCLPFCFAFLEWGSSH